MNQITPFPTGTITFLFTDIDGSTKLWEAHPAAMRIAVARHDALLRQAVDENNGYLFKTTGDGVAAAFGLASDALAAALACQLALLAEPWPQDVVLRSRMGIHTGAAELRDGDYFGSTLNRCARVTSVGHGGQTLLSDVTHELCRDSLPPGVSLLRLGEHRLKDLARPETVYQLAHAALAAEFSKLRTLDATPNNLPQQLTTFIGREKPLADVAAILGKTRLLTLTGTGGTGKTRLSLQAAADMLDRYQDGVWLVELAALSDPLLVPQTVASALGVREQSSRSLTQTLTDFLKHRQILLLLDNCEHLLVASATFVAALLRTCPGVTVLATSRELLGIAGETTYRVPSLSLPGTAQATAATPASLNQFEAVRLFIDRALLVKSDFTVTNANAPALAQLCHRLDGIPLAIELAAARVRSLPIEQINDKLDSRFRLLTGGDRSALPRQQTLRALIDWSYDLLAESEKAMLLRLSVFSGGWTLDAAAAVCAGALASPGWELIPDWQVLDFLTSLADKSLIHVEEQAGMSRYGMLETVRQYAGEKLAETGELESVRARHGEFFGALAEDARLLMAGPDQATWLNRLETEHDNFRAAFDALTDDTDTAEPLDMAGARLATALARFWETRGYLSEGREQLARSLRGYRKRQTTNAAATAIGAANEETEASVKKAAAEALRAAGVFAYSQGDYMAARPLLDESLPLFLEIGDKRGVASILTNQGLVASGQGNARGARPFLEASLPIYREIGFKPGIASTLNLLGTVASNLGDYEVARSVLEDSLGLFREIGDRRGIAYALINLSSLAINQGNYITPRLLLEESISLCREIGNKYGIACSQANQGLVANKLGDYAGATAILAESLRLFCEIGDIKTSQECLEGMAAACLGRGDRGKAVVLWGAASALRERLGRIRTSREQMEIDSGLMEARTEMGEAAFAAVWKEGSAMDWDQAVELALS